MRKSSLNVKNLTLAAMFLALAVIMPRLVHFMGPEAGKMFLPLFWGVAFSSLILPLRYTLMIGVLSPLISYMISGMPGIPMLQFMMIELMVYALAVSLLHRKLNGTVSILLGILISRMTYIASVMIAANLLGLPAPGAGFAVLFSSISVSIPGIIAQVVLAPIVERVSKHERFNREI